MSVVKIEVANFTGSKGEIVDMVKINGGKSLRATKVLEAINASNRDEVIRVLNEAIRTATPKQSVAAPTTAVYCYGFTGSGESMPLSKPAALEFCLANINNPAALVHVNGNWHGKDNWVSLGLMPPAPPVPAAPSIPAPPPVPSAPAVPSAPTEPKKGLAAMIGK